LGIRIFDARGTRKIKCKAPGEPCPPGLYPAAHLFSFPLGMKMQTSPWRATNSEIWKINFNKVCFFVDSFNRAL